MAKQIKSIKTVSSKYSFTVYVNFSDGTYGCHTKENGKWFDGGLTAEQLAAAKKLALVNGKWTSWTAPKVASQARSGMTGSYDDEDARTDLESMSKFENEHPSKPDGFLFGDSKEG